MISPEKILEKKFEKGRGYDKKEVDEYVQQLYLQYSELYRKYIEMQDQIQTLNGGLQHYKSIETSLQKALILAEKTADETIQTAKLRSESILREAENKASRYSADSKSELESVHGKTIDLMQEYVKYKAQFNKLIQEQLELLNGSKFDIQSNDLLAFKKNETDDNNADLKNVTNISSKDMADTVPLPTIIGENASADNNVESFEKHHTIDNDNIKVQSVATNVKPNSDSIKNNDKTSNTTKTSEVKEDKVFARESPNVSTANNQNSAMQDESKLGYLNEEPTKIPTDDEIDKLKQNLLDEMDSDNRFESAIPEVATSVEVYPGIKVKPEDINRLDYLNAAEKFNEQHLDNQSK